MTICAVCGHREKYHKLEDMEEAADSYTNRYYRGECDKCKEEGDECKIYLPVTYARR